MIALRRFIDRHILLLTLIPVLAVMLMIFGFSAQNDTVSDQMSDPLTEFVLRIVCPDYETLHPAAREALFERVSRDVRKTAHFTEFAALGFFLMGHFRALELKKSLRHPALCAAVTGILYAVSDELHQKFVGGRSPAIFDVGIDSFGVLFGILVMTLLLRMRRLRKPHSSARKPEKAAPRSF